MPENKVPDPQPEVAPPPEKPHTGGTTTLQCRRCGTPLVRRMFRTGSVQHPGGETSVCPSCGTRH